MSRSVLYQWAKSDEADLHLDRAALFLTQQVSAN